MAKKILVDYDFAKNSLNNARIQNLGADPSSPVVGQTYFNTGSNKLRTYNGSTWDEYGTSTASGDVTGPSSSVDSEVALFSSTTGKVIKRATASGIPLLTSGVLSVAAAGDFPTLNQNTTGSAASFTGSLVGDVTGTQGATVVGKINGVSMAGLSTGIVKNTTTTGVPSIAVAGDFPTLNQNTTGTAANVTGTVLVANGGTGRATATTAYGLIAAGTTATGVQQTIAPGTSGNFLKSGGASALAAFAAIAESDVTNLVTDLAAKAPLASPTFTGTVTVPTPSGATDAATKAYVDAAAAGIDWKASVRAATTATGTLATAYANGQVVDGVTLATGDRILIKDQSTASENGIYVVAASGAPTRATDADANNEVTAGMSVFVEEGTVNDNTGWVLTNNGAVTLGTTGLTFVQFTGLGEVTASTGLTKTGNTISIDSTVATLTGSQAFTNKNLTGAGNTFPTFNQNTTGSAATLTTPRAIYGNNFDGSAALSQVIASTYGGTGNGFAKFSGPATTEKTFTLPNASATLLTDNTAVTVLQGGTGATTAATARANLSATGKFTGTIGDGSTTAIAVTHSLGSQYVVAQVFDATSNALVECDITLTSSTVTTFTFATAPTTNQYRVVIVG